LGAVKRGFAGVGNYAPHPPRHSALDAGLGYLNLPSLANHSSKRSRHSGLSTSINANFQSIFQFAYDRANPSSMTALSNNGLLAHQDFPVEPYEAIHSHVGNRWPHAATYSQFTGAWNALAYRFHAAIDAGAKFQKSLKDFGPHPAPHQRYQQEEALFNFFSNGFAAFEAIFYGIFAIGSFIDSSAFQLATPKEQQRVSPSHTADAFKQAFPDDLILEAFEKLFADRSYQRWREMRNVLTHRAAPGRRIFVGIGIDDAPPVEWKLNDLPLDSTLVPTHQSELARLITNVITATEVFLKSWM
jgi:hypothetical protein